jgi:glucose/arabinose dehydrogenase
LRYEADAREQPRYYWDPNIAPSGPDGALYLLTDSSNGRLLKMAPKPSV